MMQDQIKAALGKAGAALVQEGMKVGLGTGSTAYYLVLELAERVKNGLHIQATATSHQTEELAAAHGIVLQPLHTLGTLDITLDGADEYDPNFDLIKGGGGALFREKMVASCSRRFVVLADPSKAVEKLGKFKVPVEVSPFAWEVTFDRLTRLGGRIQRRMTDTDAYVTDNGNYIFDCDFGLITHPGELHGYIRNTIGVLETGLFVGMATDVLTTDSGGGVVHMKKSW